MPRPYASGIVPATADEVWHLVRDFNGLPGWHPAIAGSELEAGGDPMTIGAVRRLTLGDGAIVRERLMGLDNPGRNYTYDIIESPFPVRSYRSTIRVAPVTATGQAFVEWWVYYDADGSDEEQLNSLFADDVFAGGIAGLANHFG